MAQRKTGYKRKSYIQTHSNPVKIPNKLPTKTAVVRLARSEIRYNLKYGNVQDITKLLSIQKRIEKQYKDIKSGVRKDYTKQLQNDIKKYIVNPTGGHYTVKNIGSGKNGKRIAAYNPHVKAITNAEFLKQGKHLKHHIREILLPQETRSTTDINRVNRQIRQLYRQGNISATIAKELKIKATEHPSIVANRQSEQIEPIFAALIHGLIKMGWGFNLDELIFKLYKYKEFRDRILDKLGFSESEKQLLSDYIERIGQTKMMYFAARIQNKNGKR